MAGFGPARADDLRKAVGEEERDLIATMKKDFLEGRGSTSTPTAASLPRPLGADGGGRDYSFDR